MYLKRIEVSGFKSFADQIKLDFEPGITSVVGPNGCGKSNIIDAIRWCLGEMSAKSLRSNLMMDVVFNGTSSRPPHNMSEVTLTFDNSDKRLPIDYSEVSVGRRLFRSGESEYFLNKSQCRLRDIRELFLDTGMGEDGYSFMAQGKVEWILSAKPEERRELFEEAAGVSKYRARREEAMRKLDRVEIDLSRLADIISVTQDQIRKLENAVNRAKNYQKVRDQLKNLEIGNWLFELENGDQNLKEIETRFTEAQGRAEALNTEIHSKDSEVAQLRLDNAQAEEELLAANSKLNEVDSNIKINEERKSNGAQREEELRTQSVNISNNIEREKGRIQELQGQQEEHQKGLDNVVEEGKNIEPDYVASKEINDQALKNLEDKRNQAKSIREGLVARSEERTQLQNQIGQLTSEVSRLASELEARQKETARINTQIEDLKQQAEDTHKQTNNFYQQLTIKSNEQRQLEEQIKFSEEKEGKLRQDVIAITELIAGLKGQIDSIKGQQSQDPYIAGSQAATAHHFEGVYGPLNRLISCSDADRDLVTSTLGEHLADLVAESTESAQQIIDFLRSENRGRARVWILNRIPETPESSVAQLPSGDKFIQKVNCDEKFKPLVSHIFQSLVVQDTTVFGNGYVNGGVDPAKWKSHSLLRLDEIEKTLEEKEARRNQLDENLKSLEIEKGELAKKKETAFKEIEELRVRHQISDEEKGKIAEKQSLLQEELKVVESEILHAGQDREKAKTALGESQEKITALETQEKEDNANLDIIQHELTELQEVHTKTSAELSAKQERHNSYQEKLKWQSNTVEQIKQDIENANKNIVHFEETLKQIAIDVEGSAKAQEEASQNIASLLTDRTQAAEACTQIQNRRTEITNKVNEIESGLSSIRKEFEAVQGTIHSEEINKTSLKGRLETIGQKLLDQYEMGLEQAKGEFKPEQADAELLEKLKKRVSNMGPINLAAPQEHEELLQKNEFLVNQQNDLVKAKQDLRDVISKINATTREHFRETFQKVRENFKRIYSTLFQGGEADLHFTNEADILSTGIDIFCQPPGKKLLHISLMSGGEKALTAVALLFAFFQVRPSPLALLDEVDAPLDEANVTRFVKMVKTFAENTQFILISHNKRTMEAANTLYGVTMEELGVSRVISTRLVHESKQKQKEPDAVAEEATPA